MGNTNQIAVAAATETSDQELVQQAVLLALEITRRGIAHVSCNYAGYIDGLFISVAPIDQEYEPDVPHWTTREPVFAAITQLEELLAAGQQILFAGLVRPRIDELTKKIENFGYRVSGPAAHGEPAWVGNARAEIAALGGVQ